MAFNILGIFSFLSDLAPFLLLITHRQLLKKKLLLALFIWTIVSLIADFLIIIFPGQTQDEYVAFFSIILEVLFVCAFYYTTAARKTTKRINLAAGALFAIVCIYELCTQNIDGFKYWLAASAALLTMILSVIIFFDFFNAHQNSFLLSNYQIWVPLAYMIYAAGNLFLFATTEHFPNVFSDPGMWSIFLVANIIKNSFFVKAVVLARKGKPKTFATHTGSNGFTYI
jgi:hypothetical protein